MNYPKTGRVGNGVCATDCVKLVDERPDLELGRVDRDPQKSGGDGLVGGALG